MRETSLVQDGMSCVAGIVVLAGQVFPLQLGLRVGSSEAESQPALRPLPLAGVPDPGSLGGRIRIERIAPQPRAEGAEAFLPRSYSSLSISELDSGSFPSWTQEPLTDSRFASQLPSNYAAGLGTLWGGELRMILETAPSRTILADPFAEERSDSAWKRGERHFRALLRKSAKQTALGKLFVEEMRDWRSRPLSFLAALAGASIEQETPDGGRLTFGPDWNDLQDAASAGKILRVRYTVGPFETRAEPREAWVRYKVDLLGFSAFARTAYDYFDRETSYQLGLSKDLDVSTRLQFLGGTGISAESLTGFSSFPIETGQERRVGIVGFLERRF